MEDGSMEDVRLSVAVMAHPKRARYVEHLLPRLDVEDPPVVWDRFNDRWDTGRRALMSYEPDATHHLVVQDDAVPCRDLVQGCARLLEHVPPEAPVGLYVGYARTQPWRFSMVPLINLAGRRRAAFLIFEGPWWGQSLIVPTADVPDIVSFGDRHPEIENYDHKIANWYARQNIECWYTMPSLVSHRTDGPSLVPGRGNGRRRVSAWFHGQQNSALNIDWSKTTIHGPSHARDLPPTPHTPGWMDKERRLRGRR